MSYPFLNGLRALSVFLVIAHHLNVFVNLKPLFGSYYQYVSGICSLGFIGVDIFFVISGFLITGLLLPVNHTTPNIYRFYVRRFFKIVPSYLAVVGVSYLIFIPYMYPDTGKVLINYLSFTQNYTAIYYPLGHLWSIAIEEHFYILYPLIIYIIFLVSPKNTQLLRRNLILALLALIIIGIISRYYYFHHTAAIEPWPWQKTHARFDALLIGGLLRCLEPFLPKQQHTKIICSYLSLTLALILLFTIRFMPPYSMNYLDYSIAYLFAAFLILSCLLSQHFISTILSIGLLQWVGKNSYGIYLWHYLLLIVLTKTSLTLPVTWPSIVLILTIIIMVGALSTATIERFFLKLRNHIQP